MFDLEEGWLSGEPTLSEVLEALRERRRLPEQADWRLYKKRMNDLFTSVTEPEEELLHLPDGSTLRYVVLPHPFGGLQFMSQDVTDRYTLERSYSTLTAVQRATLDNLFEAVAVFGADGRLKLSLPSGSSIRSNWPASRISRKSQNCRANLSMMAKIGRITKPTILPASASARVQRCGSNGAMRK